MGRMEALVVAALGRSPYEEQLLGPQTAPESNEVGETGQRYDERGHPVNLETRQRMRDHVRASNEVMQTAGIIEETADIQARDKAVENNLRQETEVGLRRLEFGRVLLVAGVWGVVGLRRRILVYQSYSGNLLDIIRRERAYNSIPHLATIGTPALAVYQCIEWTNLLFRAVVNGPYGEAASTGSRLKERGVMFSRIILEFGFGYFMVHYQMFAILQQLDLVSSKRLFPSLRSLIPSSPSSPLQIPPWPASFTTAALSLWSTNFVVAAAPLALVLAHTAVSAIVSSLIYAPLFRLLPRPVNRQERLIAEMTKTLHELEETIATAMTTEPAPISPAASEFEAPANGATTGPTQHAATLQALEGRQSRPDDSSDEEDHGMSQQALITFDVEATELTEAAMGTWSAELRSANEPPPKEAVYQITALTMLPPLLAAEGLSSVLTDIVLLPVEALMVRTIARSFRRSAGLATNDIYALQFVPSQTWFSLVAVHTFELAVTGVLWAAFIAGSQFMSGKHLLWRRSGPTVEK